MQTDIELGEATTKGNHQGYNHEQGTRDSILHVSPGEPASDKTDEAPAHSVTTGIAVDVASIFIYNYRNECAGLLFFDTSAADRWSLPPCAQSHQNFCRAMCIRELRTG